MFSFFFFFFSSRRRHTRSLRDWSSDVCSSDLALPDAVRSAAENDNLAPLARIRFAFRRGEPVPLVAGIHVRSRRRELSRASIDPLVNGLYFLAPATSGYGFLVESRELAEAGIRKAHLL